MRACPQNHRSPEEHQRHLHSVPGWITFKAGMTKQQLITCDGCGQVASPEHLAARLRRLECASRWRPLHIQTLLLGAVAPAKDADFIYAESGGFSGEAGWALQVAGVSPAGEATEAVQHEF